MMDVQIFISHLIQNGILQIKFFYHLQNQWCSTNFIGYIIINISFGALGFTRNRLWLVLSEIKSSNAAGNKRVWKKAACLLLSSICLPASSTSCLAFVDCSLFRTAILVVSLGSSSKALITGSNTFSCHHKTFVFPSYCTTSKLLLDSKMMPLHSNFSKHLFCFLNKTILILAET